MSPKPRTPHRGKQTSPSPPRAQLIAPIDPNTYLDEHGHLRPTPVSRPLVSAEAVTPELERLWSHLALADELQQAARATNTQATYGWHVRQFIAWCERHNVNPLPASPETVMAHLADSALQTDEYGNPLRDVGGGLVADVGTSMVTVRLAAVNKLHEYAQVPLPGDNEKVRAVVSSLARTFGTRAKQPKAAADLDALSRMVDALGEREYRAARDVAIVWARRAGLSSGQLAALQWQAVTITDVAVEIVKPRHPAATRDTVLRVPSPRGHLRSPYARTAVEAFRRLAELSPSSQALVFAHPTGKPLGRHAFVAVVNRVGAKGGGFAGWPKVNVQRVAEAAGEIWWAGTAVVRRDAAMLTTGWYLAHRRSNLVALRWDDLTFTSEGVQVLTRFSKTDQTGVGVTQFLPRVEEGDDAPDPSRALELWRDAYRLAMGVETLAGSWPVFPVMMKNGNVDVERSGRPQRLAGEAVNTLVKETALAAGLPGSDDPATYGAHSLRAGFVTEALRDDKLSIPEVQEVTGHKSVETLLKYRREANLASRSPAAALLKARAKKDKDG